MLQPGIFTRGFLISIFARQKNHDPGKSRKNYLNFESFQLICEFIWSLRLNPNSHPFQRDKEIYLLEVNNEDDQKKHDNYKHTVFFEVKSPAIQKENGKIEHQTLLYKSDSQHYEGDFL